MASLTSSLNQEERNWLDLPSDVMINILNKVDMADIFENVEKVCTAWNKICKDPSMWRVINMNDLLPSTSKLSTAAIMCKLAIDRSQGQLVDITLLYDYKAVFFRYVADRSSQIRRLEMACNIFCGSLTTIALMKFPLLEELNLYAVSISEEEIETIGRYCPMLKTFKVNEKVPRFQIKFTTDEGSLCCLNAKATAIGQNLVELRHLELIGNSMTNFGLQVILDNCHYLETLDLRACFNLDIMGDLGKKCSEQIKYLKLPNDPLEGCPYFDEIVGESSEEDYYESGGDYEVFENYEL